MSDFKPVVLHKDGKVDRIAYSPTALVQLQHDGYVVKREASKTAVKTGSTVVLPPAPKTTDTETDTAK